MQITPSTGAEHAHAIARRLAGSAKARPSGRKPAYRLARRLQRVCDAVRAAGARFERVPLPRKRQPIDLDRLFHGPIGYPKQTPEQIEAQIAAARARWAAEDAARAASFDGTAPTSTVYLGPEPVDDRHDEFEQRLELSRTSSFAPLAASMMGRRL